jgi:ferrochelatase
MKISVILLNLGGPDSPSAVKPFLFNLFNDKAILRMPALPRYILAWLISTLRFKKAQGIYALMGGASPIVPNTHSQADALEKHLNEDGMNASVTFCMRYWHPRAEQVVTEVVNQKPDHVVLMPLYPQFSTTTTQSSFDEWMFFWNTHKETSSIPVHRCESYFDNAHFIRAHEKLMTPYIDEALTHGRPLILFSAHGLPQDVIDDGDPYQQQIDISAHLIFDALREKYKDTCDMQICYQSRVGPKKWLDPYTDKVIEDASREKRPLVIVPIAFVSDHSETLVELDIEYKELALEHGAPYYGRVPALGNHPDFITCLAEQVHLLINKVII